MAVKASGANVNLRLRGTASDGETDINEEINGESTDANANVSLATLSTGVGFDTTDGGHKMSEFFGYTSFTPAFNTSNFETVTYTGNGSTQAITSKIRKAASFNGSSSYIENTDTSIWGATWTISLWFKTSNNSGRNPLFVFGRGSWTDGIELQAASSNTVAGSYAEGTKYFTKNVSTDLDDNNFHHYCATYDSSTDTVKLYIDGNEETGLTTGTGNSRQGSGYRIGRFFQTPEQWATGSIDQVRIFDKALSSSEVTTLYGETYTSSTKSKTDIFNDSSGVALFELDEDANDTGSYPYGTGDIDAGQSAVFDGSTSKVALSGSTSLTNRTISMWFNPSKSTSLTLLDNTQGKVKNQKQFGRWNMLFNYGGSNYAVWNEYNGSQYGMATFSYTFQVGTWYHIAFCVQSGNNAVYVNGVSQTLTVTRGTSIGTVNLADCALGFDRDFSSLRFDGKIDQVRIYSSALSASDVEALVSETNVPTANLIAHYKLDGNANTAIGSYNGTWSGTEAYTDPAEFPNVGYPGTPTNVSFVGTSFQPDLIWVKSRNHGYSHHIQDVIRGAGAQKDISSDGSWAEGTFNYGSVDSFDANGFTVGSGGHPTYGRAQVNESGKTYVAWCWKAGGAAVSGTSSQATSVTMSPNPDAGFSIIKFTSSTSTAQPPPMNYISHGLNAAPEMVIYKRTNDSQNWVVQHNGITTNGALTLNETYQQNGPFTYDFFDNTSTNIGVRSNYAISRDEPYIAYAFHSVVGYQKVGSYTGNNGNGVNKITLDFEPRWLMVKKTTDTLYASWYIFDTVRGDAYVQADQSYAESQSATYNPTFLTDGFQWENGDNSAGWNNNGGTYIYLAIA